MTATATLPIKTVTFATRRAATKKAREELPALISKAFFDSAPIHIKHLGSCDTHRVYEARPKILMRLTGVGVTEVREVVA